MLLFRCIAVLVVLSSCGQEPVDSRPSVAFVRQAETWDSDGSVSRIDINQGVYDPAFGTETLVAGKLPTVMVSISMNLDLSGNRADFYAMEVEVFAQGLASTDQTKLCALKPIKNPTPSSRIFFSQPADENCGVWGPGRYTLKAYISGKRAEQTFTFVKRRPVRILAVPLKARYGTVVQVPDAKFKKAGEFLRTVWPVGYLEFSWSVREDLDVTEFDITQAEGQRKVWDALANLNPKSCETRPTATGCYDAIMGFVKSRINGTLQGYTFGAPAVVNVNDDEDVMATVAHEFGHMAPFKLGDEYKGGSYNCTNNPPPASYVGSDFNTPGQMNFSCTNSTEVAFDTEGRMGTGSLIPTTVDAYDFGRGALDRPLLSFMGSGSKQADVWVRPSVYKHLFDVSTPFDGTADPVMGTVVQLSGWILKADGTTPGVNDVQVDPWFSYTGVLPTEPATPTEFTARAYDGATELSRQNLKAVFWATDPVRPLDEVPLEGALTLPAGATRIDLLKGTVVMKSIPVSANAPVVMVNPVTTTGMGEQMISWTGTDLDPNTTLTYLVEYCENDTSACDVIEPDTTQTQISINLDEQAGAPAAFVRITATDGVRSTSANSLTFNVPFKAPDVEILEPDGDEASFGGRTIAFDAMVFDEQDTMVTDPNNLKWVSDRDGEIGKGTRFSTSRLSAGTHVVTLTATNSKGLSNSESVTLEVLESPMLEAVDGGTQMMPTTPPPGCGCAGSPADLLTLMGLFLGVGLLRRRR